MKVGDRVFVSKEINYAWTGEGDVVKIHDDGLYANLIMRTGSQAGRIGGFEISKLQLVSPVEIVGETPHGFGVWVDGKFHPVDIGALGKIITDLQEWKESALKSMNKVDLQQIGTTLGLPVGTDITTETLVNAINICTRKPNYVFEKFEDYFDIWDTTGDPELHRLCGIVWRVSRMVKK